MAANSLTSSAAAKTEDPTVVVGDASTLGLSEDVIARLASASATLRVSPNELIGHLLRSFYSTLRGLPPHVLFYIFSFLDYSTVSSTVSLTCRSWHDAVKKGEPSKFFGGLRQAHGVHVMDPVRGVFYFPRALKRVLVVPDANDDSRNKSGAVAVHPTAVLTAADGSSTPPPPQPQPHRLPASATAQAVSAVAGDMAAPASSFLTVDIRTQDTRSTPWANVRSSVQRAVEVERVTYGEVRSPGLQRPEEPALTQAAVTTFNRTIYVFGGESYEGVVLSRCYAYDPVKKRWNGLPQLREARAGACAAGFGGRVYVFGGYDQNGDVLDTYEVLDVATNRWLNPVVVNGSRGFHMPSKACGLAVTVYEDVLILAGGYRSRLAPEDTAYTYSIADSATATPMHGFPSMASVLSTVTPAGGGVSVGEAPNRRSPPGTPSLATTTAANPATSVMTAHSISRDGPLDAEGWVWVLAPRTHMWCTDGPALPSPRAFGSLTVLELLPALGPCLCYFGGCARADQPETAMLYVPLAVDANSSANDARASASDTAAPTDDDVEFVGPAGLDADTGSNEHSFLYSATALLPAYSAHGTFLDELSATVPSPATTTIQRKSPVERGKPAKDARLLRYFRREAAIGNSHAAGSLCEWQRYTRIPLGGALTSVAVVGRADSRTVVLSSFYPAALIGYCKVKDLIPADVALRLSRALSPVREQPLEADRAAASPSSRSLSRISSPVLEPTASTPPPPASALLNAGQATSLPAPLDTSLQLEAFDNAQQQLYLEREWSQHQRRELRRLMGAAATAASRKRPIAPQTAGEARKWSLAPMAEVQVRDDRGRPLLNRVSWKTQSLNAFRSVRRKSNLPGLSLPLRRTYKRAASESSSSAALLSTPPSYT